MRLKELREEKNLSQLEIAKALNTSQSNIARWENELNEPSSGFLIQLAKYFGCSIDYIVGLSDDFGNITFDSSSAPALTSEENNLLEDFRSLPRQEKAQASEYVHYLAQRRGQAKKA
ncbi:MAG: helix-turn-helix transcriptional regulator [Clostridiales bacterium]|nr:helix-turn-helix transcriptional regulator [Clostridiales bacterium]